VTKCSPNQLFEEKLSICNFFSIEKFEWNINNLNILVGPMASGKSISMKLVYFFEKAPKYLEKANSKDSDVISKYLNEKFNKIFGIEDQKGCGLEKTELTYIFREKLGDERNDDFNPKTNDIFNLAAKWSESKMRLKWEIETNFRTIEELKDISSDFFPLRPVFIPASRSTASVKPLEKNKNKDGIYDDPYIEKDYFLKKFLKYKREFLLNFNETKLNSNQDLENTLDILEVKKKDDTLVFKNKRRTYVNLDCLASGQAENLYLLPFICDMDYIQNPLTSLFIEEPDAHLFPGNQLEVIKFLVERLNKVRNEINKEGAFFLSTHSTYIIDRICTFLLNGVAQEKGKEYIKELTLFDIKDVSVYAIKPNKDRTHFTVEKFGIHETGYFIDDPMFGVVDIIDADNEKLFNAIEA